LHLDTDIATTARFLTDTVAEARQAVDDVGIATAALCLILALAALFFFVIAFALWLAKIVGGAWSFTIMGGVMLLVIIVVLIGRKRWIVQPVARFVASLFVGESEEEAEGL